MVIVVLRELSDFMVTLLMRGLEDGVDGVRS